jgi:hypothetical protein
VCQIIRWSGDWPCPLEGRTALALGADRERLALSQLAAAWLAKYEGIPMTAGGFLRDMEKPDDTSKTEDLRNAFMAVAGLRKWPPSAAKIGQSFAKLDRIPIPSGDGTCHVRFVRDLDSDSKNHTYSLEDCPHAV